MNRHTSQKTMVFGMLMLVGMVTIARAQSESPRGPQVVSPANAPQDGGREFEYLQIAGVGHGVAYAEQLELTDPAIEKFFAQHLKPKL